MQKKIILILFHFLPVISWCCDCQWLKATPENIHLLFEHSDIVFVGQLIEQSQAYAFEVILDYKDAEQGDTLVGSRKTSCSIIPKEPGLWIVYASRPGSDIDISMCSFSRRIARNQTELNTIVASEPNMASFQSEIDISAHLHILDSLRNTLKIAHPYPESTFNRFIPWILLAGLAFVTGLIVFYRRQF